MLNLGHAGHKSAVIVGFLGVIDVSVLVGNLLQIYIEIGVNLMVIIEDQVDDSYME